MKFTKYVLALAIAFCAIISVSNAQSVFIGGGSSALALEVGQAAVVYEDSITGPNTACVWSRKTGSLHSGSTMNAVDNRLGPTTESGNVWVVWDKGTGADCQHPAGSFNVFMYTNLDSVLGDRGFFEADPGDGTAPAGTGYVQHLVLAANDQVPSPADNILNSNPTSGHTFTDNPLGIPTTVINLLNEQHWNFAGTDIRPEDAKYATYRALSPCNAGIYRQPFDLILRQTAGLGYSNGNSITDAFGAGKSFHVLDFNISGNDPINTTAAVPPNWAVSIVGAQPIIVGVGPITGASGTGIYQATDIPTYVLSQFFLGVLSRPNDLLGPTGSQAVTALVREPLSGTYNTFEYSNVNSSQFHNSQDQFNCSPAPGNPLNLPSSDGANGIAARKRVIGTGQMVTQIGNGTDTDERIGYFFWSAGNVGSGTGAANIKYLTVGGVDPIQNTYTNGALPSSGAPGDPCGGTVVGCTNITFAGLKSGDYPLWSALRLVTVSPVPAQISNLITAAQTLNSTQFDFVPLTALNVWRSHYYLPAIGINTASNGPTINPATPGDLCNSLSPALAEQGGDAGGAIITKKANADFCSDYNVNYGLVNKTE
jgi:ABC-type phosphate transport system substrate-binding protein